MTKIFIVRHGETNLNKAGIIQCQTDTHAININGINQAKELANKLKDKNIEFIFSSPYKRAIATAAIIASNINTDIEIENDLREVYGGETLVGTNIKDFQNIKS